MREYTPGDQIRFDFDISHKVSIPNNPGSLWATFSYVGPEQTKLSQLVIPGRIIHQTVTNEGHKMSRALFESAPISLDIAPGGEYQLSKVEVKTYGGEQMKVSGMLPRGRFWLTNGEPTNTSINVEGFYWKD
jgi:hypothetical protein